MSQSDRHDGDMLDDALAAVQEIFTPPFRIVVFKTIALTLALLALAFIGLTKSFAAGVTLPYPWLATAVSIVGGAGLLVGLAFLVTPVSFIVAGFFLDELAEAVERDLDPHQLPGRALPLRDSLWISLRFSAISLAVNLAAFVLWLVPGINALAFFVGNAYLCGRGYFELAALRYLPYPEVTRLRRMHAVRLFLAGLVVAGLLALPVLNLLTPLFGTSFMVRIARRLIRRPAYAASQSGARRW